MVQNKYICESKCDYFKHCKTKAQRTKNEKQQQQICIKYRKQREIFLHTHTITHILTY